MGLRDDMTTILILRDPSQISMRVMSTDHVVREEAGP